MPDQHQGAVADGSHSEWRQEHEERDHHRHGHLDDQPRSVATQCHLMEIHPGEARAASPAFQERQLQVMLDRAHARGERTPTLAGLLEVVVGPLYFYALFTQPLPATKATPRRPTARPRRVSTDSHTSGARSLMTGVRQFRWAPLAAQTGATSRR